MGLAIAIAIASADDVIYTFGRISQPHGTMQAYVGGIQEIKKIDDHTIDFILSAPTPILLRNIIDFRVMSKAKEDNYASRKVMGTGAYKITGWQPDQKKYPCWPTKTGGTPRMPAM